jgi:hypothetical protein
MALTYQQNTYTIPRGRVFFDPFDVNGDPTGERYLGNCPSFTISVETEKAEHFSSETGLRQKDQSIVLEVNRTAALTCDNVSAQNVALFLAGSEELVSQTNTVVADEAIAGVIQGRYYQLGKTEANPAGARSVSAVTVQDDAGTPTTFVLNTDYELDATLGRIKVIEGGAITNGTNLVIDYTKATTTWQRIKTGAESELRGVMRVVSDNASGVNRDFTFPLVTLTPSGELPVIADGTDFASLGLEVEILKPQNAEAIYIDGRPA